MRVFSTLMSLSNENKSCMRVASELEIEEFVLEFFSALIFWSNEKKFRIRVD